MHCSIRLTSNQDITNCKKMFKRKIVAGGDESYGDESYNAEIKKAHMFVRLYLVTQS